MTDEEIIAKATDSIKDLRPKYPDYPWLEVPVNEDVAFGWWKVHIVTFKKTEYREDSRRRFEWKFHSLHKGK